MSDLAELRGKFIVVRIPVAALTTALEGNPDGYGIDFAITDLGELAKDFVSELNREDEGGGTVLLRALDTALEKAIDAGSLGVTQRAEPGK